MKIEVLLLILVFCLAVYDARTSACRTGSHCRCSCRVGAALSRIAVYLAGLPAFVLGLAFRRAGRRRCQVVDGPALAGAPRTDTASCIGDGRCLFVDCRPSGALADHTRSPRLGRAQSGCLASDPVCLVVVGCEWFRHLTIRSVSMQCPVRCLRVMHTDLFTALLDKRNPRGHPILAALLYAFCPAAARWWLAGADPVIPFDPLWQALEDLISGSTLKEALSSYGFESLVDVAQTYVNQVDAWRDRHPGIDAPELLPTFPGGRIEMSRRFGHRAGIRKFGGRWENFFAYVRAWAFVVRDWEAAMRFPKHPQLSQVRLALTLKGIRRPADFPAWSWMS